MANHYEIGQIVRMTGTFTDSDGNAQDPTEVYLDLLEPDETASTLQYGVDAGMTKSATGIYYFDQAIDQDGFWYYRWYSTGTGEASDESYFRVRKSKTA